MIKKESKTDRDTCIEHMRKCYPKATMLSIDWDPKNIRFKCEKGHIFSTTWEKYKAGEFCDKCCNIPTSKIGMAFKIISALFAGLSTELSTLE